MRNRFGIGDLVTNKGCVGLILGIEKRWSFLYGRKMKYYEIDWFFVPWREKSGLGQEVINIEWKYLRDCRKLKKDEKIDREKWKKWIGKK